MGDVLPFIARVRESGDWSAAERARLEELGRQFTDSGLGVEVVFGTTDDGDPWCVVKDQNEEILVHVARIGGRFVVHYAVDDAVAEGSDLHLALAERLAPADEPPQADVVVPFSLAGRQAQTFIALIVATAFFYETSAAMIDVDEPVEALQIQDDPTPPPPVLEDDAAPDKREIAANAVVLSADPAPEPHAAAAIIAPEPPQAKTATLALAGAGAASEAPAAAPPPPADAAVQVANAAPTSAFNLIRGTDGDDVLTGTTGIDHIEGGAGDDTLSGGGTNRAGYDFLQGGDGDDKIVIDAETIAEGGAGTDTFVLSTPVVMGHAETLLGVILDLRLDEGDKLETDRGTVITPGKPPPEPPTFTPTPSTDKEMGTEQQPSPPDSLLPFGPGHRLEVDLDGDGVIDGYVWVVNLKSEPGLHEPEPILTVGQGLGSWDIGV